MISIIVATMNRPRMLYRMLQSLYSTTANHEIEIVIVVDEDDESLGVIDLWWRTDRRFVVDYSPKRRGALVAWNRALTLCQGDIIVPTGDDQIFHPHWIEHALESHKEKLGGYGMVGMNDLAYNGNTQLATMWLFDRQYCKDVMGGIFAPPCYKYYCVDSEWNEKAKSLGHFYWDERSKVEHLHSAHGKRPVDEVDLSKDTSWMAEDNKVFADRKARGFPIEWSPII